MHGVAKRSSIVYRSTNPEVVEYLGKPGDGGVAAPPRTLLMGPAGGCLAR